MLDDKSLGLINGLLVSRLDTVGRRMLIFELLVHFAPVEPRLDAFAYFLRQRLGKAV